MKSAQNDPHKREYYLAQIPFTEDQVATSNLTMMDGLYNSGVIFKDKLDNLDLSKKQFTRLETQYPDSELVASIMKMAGYEVCDNENEADAIFLNTCSIRENAENKVINRLDILHAMGKKRETPLIIGVPCRLNQCSTHMRE